MTDRNHPKFGARWDGADDAVLIEHYATRGAVWCAGQMPWRTVAAIRSRAHEIKCGATPERRSALLRDRSVPAGWTPPGPRYASVWDFANGVTA